VCPGPDTGSVVYGEDFDNDGFPDLFCDLSMVAMVLYRNNGKWNIYRTFTDKAGRGRAMSLGGVSFLEPTFFGLMDRDGWLDLYVGSLRRF